jgi:hypothetical protein
MRITLAICVLAAVVGCGAGAAQTSQAAATDLKVTVWPEGQNENESETYTVRCEPARGTLPRAATACSKLDKLANPFKPVARDAVCTDQYGGPDEALVTGTYEGRRVWARFTLNSGCQITRAKRIAFLLPGFGSASS